MRETKAPRKERSETPTVSTDEARAQLGVLANRAGFGRERIILTRHGKPVAALVGLEDLRTLEGAA